jgi:EAL domain-containing protein (putative c-di-GMP-specific phosphodiesterase class I)/DNA-binding response OmpR family regulator
MSLAMPVEQPLHEITPAINRALIIDDDEDYRNLIVRKLSRSFAGIKISQIDPRTDAMPDESYPWDQVDFIILDYQLGIDVTGLDWFKQFKPGILPATILLTAKGSEELAVRAMKLGIDDYIVKEHFDNERLMGSIQECVEKNREEKNRIVTLQRQSVVFNKSSFIQRLRLITANTHPHNHLILINPESYQQVGKQKGINHQDGYIKYISEKIHDYLAANGISHNIFIYREEYIAVIIEIESCRKPVEEIYNLLQEEKYIIGHMKYGCSVNIGVISPQTFEAREHEKSDFELLSMAMVLCNSVKNNAKKHICTYGDINILDTGMTSGTKKFTEALQSFNIESAIKDGRIIANYQPWIYVQSDARTGIKDIHDVRIEFIDTKGNAISQYILIKLLDNPYAKRLVDKWTLRSAASLLKDYRKTNDKSNIKLAVKITLSSFTDPAFVPWLRNLLVKAELPNECLLIETDARQLIKSPEDFQLLVNTVGVEFNLKFVLSGVDPIDIYYKTREIHKFNFVKLNINKLIYGLPRDPLRRLMNDIRNDGAKVVAVNISDAQMLVMANDFDVEYMHGYLIGRPNNEVISDSDGDLYCVI